MLYRRNILQVDFKTQNICNFHVVDKLCRQKTEVSFILEVHNSKLTPTQNNPLENNLWE